MHLALFGATGRVGGRLLEYALAEGHTVRALVRDPAKLVPRAGLTVLAGDVLDPAAVAARKATPGAAVPVAEFVLKGKILEDRSNAGRTRQASFVFQLTLVEVKSSLAVWQDEKIVTKQGSKNSVGF